MATLLLDGVHPICGISLDLDDTLWPIAPTMARAEAVLHAWFERHHPQVAAAFSVPVMRQHREQIWQANPHLQHDFTATRLMSLRAAMLPFGASEADVTLAFEVYFAARNEVTLFPGAAVALGALAARLPIVSLSNGNADLQRIGIAEHFSARIDARSFGVAKPDPAIFLAACGALGCAPEQVLHIGDHPQQDVDGARCAGLHAAWIAPDDAPWPLATPRPRLRAASLRALYELLHG
jgi:FMN hydrolase / 5-amino-6-(5-phospho-D-ribitylamino)uracil phosphatase